MDGLLSYKTICSKAFFDAHAEIERKRIAEAVFPIYPPKLQMYRALSLTPLDKIKVVILGQDPYHAPGQANGLAFSVPTGVPAPPSLRNIFTELRSCGWNRTETNLSDWAEQGVLLLNTALSVEDHRPGVHTDIWKEPIRLIVNEINDQDRPIVWMLWGNHAQSFQSQITNKKHLVLSAAHPSPLSAYRGFLGCGHFQRANEFLKENYGNTIKWGDPARSKNG